MAAENARTAEVWTELRQRLLAFVRRRVASEADAEDVLQDVFLKLHERLGTLRSLESLTAFVFQVARNAIVDSHRKKDPASELSHDVPAIEVERPAAGELASCLRPLMQELSAGDREALELTELGELTQKDLAERLGLSLTGSKSKVQRARARLKDILTDCCELELDRRGNVLGFEPRREGCCRD